MIMSDYGLDWEERKNLLEVKRKHDLVGSKRRKQPYLLEAESKYA